ncbi:MAG: hybrid sensor histidine kinase/response regulator [Polyangiaceae bacterium]|nr:hybrid sensor histidine kinase/response regulator [Polyangiaceae bacterium]
MSSHDPDDLSGLSMLELFRMELAGHSATLTDALLALERHPPDAARQLKVMMRAAHSLKGAARIVGRHTAVRVIHALETRVEQALKGDAPLGRGDIDAQLAVLDLLARSATIQDDAIAGWDADRAEEIEALVARMSSASEVVVPIPPGPASDEALAPPVSREIATDLKEPSHADASTEHARSLRLAPESLDRLFGFAGESLVAARWLENFGADLERLKRMHQAVDRRLDALRGALMDQASREQTDLLLAELRHDTARCRDELVSRMADLDVFGRGFSTLSTRLHREVVDCRMRPLSDRLQGFPRMVRDLAHQLGKEVSLTISGEATPVDREILERLEAPLGHLLRNALDHGIETPGLRIREGKLREGSIHLDARHSAGMLLLVVSDDGVGIDAGKLRATIVEKGLARQNVASDMSEAELFEFLFLPGFTMKREVTDVSGRGVGLDVVQSVINALGGNVSISSKPRIGTQFRIELPVTVSVLRVLLVEVAKEPYAFPLARIASAVLLPKERIESAEGRQFFAFRDERVGLVTAHQVLEREGPQASGDEVAVVVLGPPGRRHGVVVDRFSGERQLLVRPLDPRLGKVKNVSAAAILPDRSPVLILDIEDLLRSIDKLVSTSRLLPMVQESRRQIGKGGKRVLVVDDSLTIRELQRKLLESRGYTVDVAVDGMDGWNAVRSHSYDLVVTDVDMPRLDGIELVALIRRDQRLKSLPVMVVSYKDRPEDRRRGLDAGADHYCAKGEFQEGALLRVVADLIGEANE